MAAGEGGYWLAAVAEGVRRRAPLLLLMVVTRRPLPVVAGCSPSLTGGGCCDLLSAVGGRYLPSDAGCQLVLLAIGCWPLLNCSPSLCRVVALRLTVGC
jgi:hypothetical protein